MFLFKISFKSLQSNYSLYDNSVSAKTFLCRLLEEDFVYEGGSKLHYYTLVRTPPLNALHKNVLLDTLQSNRLYTLIKKIISIVSGGPTCCYSSRKFVVVCEEKWIKVCGQVW